MMNLAVKQKESRIIVIHMDTMNMIIQEGLKVFFFNWW